MLVTLHWEDGGTSSAKIGAEKSPDQEVRYLSQKYVERICSKDGITRELVHEIENVIFAYLDPTDTLNASDFEELRAIKTEGIRKEGNRLREELVTTIREECAQRELNAKLPEKQARLHALVIERDGLGKQIPPASSPEEKLVQDELQKKRQALTKAQQNAASQKQHLQRIIDLKTRIGAFRSQMSRFHSDMTTALTEAGIPALVHENYLPVFKGDVDTPLVTHTSAVEQRLAQLEGLEPPAEGTIKKLQADIDNLMKRETADKARQERTKQIHTRIAAINAECERLKAEIEHIEAAGGNKVLALMTRRLEHYIDYFANLSEQQKTMQDLYEPIRDRLSQQALLKGKELEFAIRTSADITSWLERGAALFDQRKAQPYGSFEKLGQEARKILLPAWTSGDRDKILAAFQTFRQGFGKESLNWQDYVRSGITLQDVLIWLHEVNHIGLEYGLKFNGVDLASLSPGTKGIVLLIVYLGMDVNDSRPLIVDQPDENLDNESIYNLLTPYFRSAKSRRQIIVITHNPNLVVNSDSEQIVVASAQKQENGLPVIWYSSGSLENNHPPLTGTRQQVCKILEGGDIAFLKRERRYGLRGQ